MAALHSHTTTHPRGRLRRTGESGPPQRRVRRRPRRGFGRACQRKRHPSRPLPALPGPNGVHCCGPEPAAPSRGMCSQAFGDRTGGYSARTTVRVLSDTTRFGRRTHQPVVTDRTLTPVGGSPSPHLAHRDRSERTGETLRVRSRVHCRGVSAEGGDGPMSTAGHAAPCVSGTGSRVVDDTDNGPLDRVNPVEVSEPPTSPGCTSPPGSTGAIGSGPGSPSPAHPPLVHARPPHQHARW